MSNLLPISAPEQNPEPQPLTFALDYHTKQFVDPAYWESAVEARFYFDEPGLQHREFVGRLVEFCSDYPVIVIQEAESPQVKGGSDGVTFVKRTLSGISNHQLQYPGRVAAYWASWLSIAQHPHTPGCPLPVLPAVAMSPSLGRLHYDADSGFGFIVTSNGYCTLVDLRDVESARESNHVFMEFSKQPILGIREMVDTSALDFHARMEALIRDPDTEAFQTLRFYKMREEERSMEVFGCDHRTLKKTMDALKLALTMSIGPGGELENYQRAVWHPWGANRDKAVGVHLNDGWWDDIEAPEKLAALTEEICAAMGCVLRYEQKCKAEEENECERVGEARMVALEWASEFNVWSESSSAHEAMEAVATLQELMGKVR